MQQESTSVLEPVFEARHMYHPTEASRIVRTAEELRALGSEWSSKAFPAPIPEPELDRVDELAVVVADLTERVEALELGVTTFPAKRKK